MSLTTIYRVALAVPTRRLFDYVSEQRDLTPGLRVIVPFGPRKLVGVILEQVDSSQHLEKLKAIELVLDEHPVLDQVLLDLCHWLSQYYHHPLGEVVHAALPVALRKGKSSVPKQADLLQLLNGESSDPPAVIRRAKKQISLFNVLLEGPQLVSRLKEHFSDGVINALVDKQVAEKVPQQLPDSQAWPIPLDIEYKPKPNVQQAIAITSIVQKLQQFSVLLIDGVTGSGKTEVYLQSIEEVINAGQQVLILVPEIGLTPQTVARFEKRFKMSVGVLHSNLTDNERLLVWQQAKHGQLAIVIGTRSAIFTPLANPGMIIVDEEHDASYKQQEGLRYNARDLAVLRAKAHSIPLVLGSATPSLESLNNATTGKYQHLILSERAGNAVHAQQNVMDITNQHLHSGIAQGMLDRMSQHLKNGSQVMLFINRRGFAPALLCHHCGFVESCPRCDKPFTVHKSLNKIQCHHCGAAKPIPRTCHECGQQQLNPHGVGTEQLEQRLNECFPEYSSVRIDSDSTRGKKRLDELLNSVNRGQHQILIGTQILSKGHHFPNVTLVVILDADGALFSADYRAAEHLAQLITQLAGRAGRADKPGEMWLQTHQPGHPLLQDLIHNGYAHFARYALLERKQANLPPFSYQVLFRAEAVQAKDSFALLSDIGRLLSGAGIQIVGPIPALMEKRQGRYRMQLLLQSSNRVALNKVVAAHMEQIESLPLARKVRWSVDTDPHDFM